MINYIKAENLKFKRTFSRKMIIFVALLNIGFSFLMNTQFFVQELITGGLLYLCQ